MLSIQRLKELFHYDAETGIFTRLKTAGGMVPGTIAGSLNPFGYLRISIDHERYCATGLHGFIPMVHGPSTK